MACVLIIDDAIPILKLLRNILEGEGYNVLTASTAREGLRLCREEKVDLVITDIIMPDKDGLETIMELRRDYPEVKIIAMSGGGRIGPEEYLHAAKHMGAQGTLCKPFTRKELSKALTELRTSRFGHHEGTQGHRKL
jgi:YesN/AraC family two-component response regulator